MAWHLRFWLDGLLLVSPAAARWWLEADDLLSLSSWPRQQLCPLVLSLKSPTLIPSLPVHWANWMDYCPSPISLHLSESKMAILFIYGRGLASTNGCTAHAQLALCLSLLHHSLLPHSQYNFLHTCFMSLCLNRIIMCVTVAVNAFSWLDVTPSAFYLLLLLEYQAAPLNLMLQQTYLCMPISLLYKYHIV